MGRTKITESVGNIDNILLVYSAISQFYFAYIKRDFVLWYDLVQFPPGKLKSEVDVFSLKLQKDRSGCVLGKQLLAN